MVEQKKKLEVGDKYLAVLIDLGGQKFKFAAFKNKEKKGKEPDFKGQNIAIWINTKQQGKVIEEEVI